MLFTRYRLLTFAFCLSSLAATVQAKTEVINLSDPNAVSTSEETAEPDYEPKKSALFHYDKFDDAIKKYEKLAEDGGWTPIPKGGKLEMNMRDPRVPLLRERLKATDEYEGKVKSEDEDLFDVDLQTALKVFQKRHGLNEDGVLGARTLTALNTSVQDRIRQLELNKDRFEDLPLALEGKYLLVNIPDFTLKLVQDDKVDLQMRVVAGGRGRNQTPLFSDEMEYIVINPRWHVPRRIAVKEILPKLRQDPTYLDKKGMRVSYVTEEGKSETVDSATIDWSTVDETSFAYHFSQDPGDSNDLGNLKFIFPNPHNVYMHDTSSRHLFSHDTRDLSHGCVRLEKPKDLAEALLKDKEGWNLQRVESVIKTGKETVVMLPEKVPVHIIYLTAWVDDDDVVQFREDVYSKDRSVKR